MSSPAQKRKVPPGGNNDDGVSLTTTQNIANTNKPHHTHPKQTNPHHSSDLKQHHQKDGSKNGKKHPKLACFYYSKSTLSNEQKQLHFDHYQTISSILGTNTLPKNKSIRPLDALNPFFPDVFIAPIKNQTSSNRFLELNFFPNKNNQNDDNFPHSYQLDDNLPQGLYNTHDSIDSEGEKTHIIPDIDCGLDLDRDSVEETDPNGLTNTRSAPKITNKTNLTLHSPNPDNQLRTNVSYPHLPLNIRKYFTQKNRIFTKFDFGILLDIDGWFSVTPELIASHVANKIIYKSVLNLRREICQLLHFYRENFSNFESNFDEFHQSRYFQSTSPLHGLKLVLYSHAELNLLHNFLKSRPITILDLFCGCAGNAIQLALVKPTLIVELVGGNDKNGQTCTKNEYISIPLTVHVITSELNKNRALLSQHNARIYGVEDQITIFSGDCFKLISSLAMFSFSPKFRTDHSNNSNNSNNSKLLKIDAVFLSPPWGGILYDQFYDINTSTSINFTVLFQHCRLLSENITFFLPKTINPTQVTNLINLPPLINCRGECLGKINKCVDKELYFEYTKPISTKRKGNCVQKNKNSDQNENPAQSSNNDPQRKSPPPSLLSQSHTVVHISLNHNSHLNSSPLHPCEAHSHITTQQSATPFQPTSSINEPPILTISQPPDLTTLNSQWGLPSISFLFIRLYLLTMVLYPDCVPEELLEWSDVFAHKSSYLRSQRKAMEKELNKNGDQHGENMGLNGILEDNNKLLGSCDVEGEFDHHMQGNDRDGESSIPAINPHLFRSKNKNQDSSKPHGNLASPGYVEPEYRLQWHPQEAFFFYFDQFDLNRIHSHQDFTNLYNNNTKSADNNIGKAEMNGDEFKQYVIQTVKKIIFLVTRPLKCPIEGSIDSISTSGSSGSNISLLGLFSKVYMQHNSTKLLFSALVSFIFKTHPILIEKLRQFRQRKQTEVKADPKNDKTSFESQPPLPTVSNDILYNMINQIITYLPSSDLPLDYYVPFEADDVQNFSFLSQTTSLSLFYHYLNTISPYLLVTNVLYPIDIDDVKYRSMERVLDQNDSSLVGQTDFKNPSNLHEILPSNLSLIDRLNNLIHSPDNPKFAPFYSRIEKISELLLSFILQPHIGFHSSFKATKGVRSVHGPPGSVNNTGDIVSDFTTTHDPPQDGSSNAAHNAKNNAVYISPNPPDCEAPHISLETFLQIKRELEFRNASSPLNIDRESSETQNQSCSHIVEFEAACLKTYSKGFNVYFQ